MNNKTLALVSIAILGLIIFSAYLLGEAEIEKSGVLTESTSMAGSDSPPSKSFTAPRQDQRQSIGSSADVGELDLDNSYIKIIMEEVSSRLSEYQTDEALNELNGLLEMFDELSDEEKGRVLVGYATYFTRLSQLEDAKFFYEATLELPNLNQANRLAIIQMLARFALNEENWDSFLAYNDQYFDEGGEYNWFVTGHLISAYRRLGNIDAAGQTLILHLNTGINPLFDRSDEQYQRSYGDAQFLPLMMSDSEAALELAQGMVDQFDRIENWKVLADLYEIRGDQLNLGRILETALDRGFLDRDGNWRLPESNQ